MAAATERLDAVVQQVVNANRGKQVKPRGEGDSHFLTFADPLDAVACSVALQQAVAAEAALPLRSGCHLGVAEFRGGDWYGTTVNRCARLRAVAHARQSLVSAEVAAAIASRLAGDVSLRSLGRHRLKDLDEPAEIFQVCAPGLVDEHPPLPTLIQSHGLSLPHSSFVGRSAELDHALALLQRGGVVTVTGAPGVGTTRFALEVAARWWNAEDRAVRVVDDVKTPDAIDAARMSPGELVVVHEAPAACAAAAQGPVVVAARSPLGAADGSVLRLPPLDEFEAESLLRDRLPEDATLSAEMVAYCDGLPLAIELLARRATSVDGDVLAQRLQADPLAVLAGHRRADPPRHAGMREALRAAFAKLDDSRQAELLYATPGDAYWVAAGWHEPSGPLPLVAQFLAEVEAAK
jgi:hypothetical protein